MQGLFVYFKLTLTIPTFFYLGCRQQHHNFQFRNNLLETTFKIYVCYIPITLGICELAWFLTLTSLFIAHIWQGANKGSILFSLHREWFLETLGAFSKTLAWLVLANCSGSLAPASLGNACQNCYSNEFIKVCLYYSYQAKNIENMNCIYVKLRKKVIQETDTLMCVIVS